MSYIPDLSADLQMMGIFDAGVPNMERVVLRARRQVSLAAHGIALAIGHESGGAFPRHDQIFWFPDLIVEPPSWIFLYTGRGTPRQTQMPNGDPAMTFHWNRESTLFNVPNAVAVAFRADEVEVGRQWPPQAQLGSGAG